MNQRPSQLTRFRVMAAMALAVLAIYLVVLFNTQVVHHEEYLAKSIQTITRMENVEASRGIITDRSGRTLVTNQSTYSLTFDASLLKPGENQNDAILRLVTLCRDQGVAWEDNLPLSLDGAAHFTVDTLTDTQKSRFFSYLRDLKPTRELLAAYVRQHPELLKPPKEGETALDPATAKDTELLKQTNSAALTNSLLLNAGVTPAKLFDWMREDMKLSDDYSDSDARLILGVRYELKLRKLGANNNPYILVENVDVEFCSLISDGAFQGAQVSRTSTRAYETTYAAHVLGLVGAISDYTDELKEKGYRASDTIGISGAESAFEEYLRGTDGKRVTSVNSDGKITGEYYKTEPRSGYTVELTLDLDLQQSVEDTLSAKVAQLNEKDGLDSRGAGAAVIKVGTGEVLALASYPSFDLSTFAQSYNELLEDERAHYYALLENGQIVGNMFLYDWQGERDFLKIMNLGVAPDRRGQGLACRLLEKAAEELKASMLMRCCGETRESNLAMRRVFERCGYRLNKTEESYYENPTESACKYVLRREELE